jgi:hypothetical protein
MSKPKLEIANVAAGGKAADHKLEIATEAEAKADAPVAPSVAKEELDADEAEFRKLRRDLPGVKGASAAGIVSVGVSRLPGGRKNEFFRTHKEFRPIVPLVDIEVGMEKQFFAVDSDMVVALAGIGITVAEHTLYLTITPTGAYRIVPIHCTTENEYSRTKEIGLLDGEEQWVRIYTDQENKVYKVFPAPKERYADPIWPVLQPAKIFRLAFRDKGRLVDSTEHPLFLKWAALDKRR